MRHSSRSRRGGQWRSLKAMRCLSNLDHLWSTQKKSPYSVSSNLDIYSTDFQPLSASKENFLDDEQSGSELMFIQKDSHSSKAIIAPLEQTSLLGPDRYHTRQRHPGVEIVDFTGFVKLKTSD